jgi:hypothetical protein
MCAPDLRVVLLVSGLRRDPPVRIGTRRGEDGGVGRGASLDVET